MRGGSPFGLIPGAEAAVPKTSFLTEHYSDGLTLHFLDNSVFPRVSNIRKLTPRAVESTGREKRRNGAALSIDQFSVRSRAAVV